MSLTVEQNQPFEAVAETGETGLAGVITVRVDNGGTVIGPTTAGIVEAGATGVYTWSAAAAPGTVGQYKIIWSTDGTYSDETTIEEDLLVLVAGTSPVPPPLPPIDPGEGMQVGPCSSWTTGDEVDACCSVDISSDSAIFDDVVDQASQLLYELSGRLYAGTCSKTVRPCRTDCGCNWQVLSRGYVVGPWAWGGYDFGYGYWNCGGQDWCGCRPVSRVKLSGYPVREITEVKIDGDVVAASEYRLDESRYVTRMDNGRWPGCQNLTLDDTEDGTWSIAYTYGMDPPLAGRAAAAQLACELYKACNNQPCALPTGTTRVTRQGVTIEKMAFTSWAYTPAAHARGRSPGWQTGMPIVDSFLNAYNRAGLLRRPTFWAPGNRYARPVG